MQRSTNHRISIDKYAAYLKSQRINHVILNPVPPNQAQEGPTCGYYALSTITYYWHSVDLNNPAFPAKKCDTSDRIQSLRFFGKKYRKHVDAIFEMETIKQIADNVGYNATVHTFNTVDEFAQIVKESLNNGIPIILPVDRGNHPKAISNSGGSRAHHIVLIGYTEEPNRLNVILTSDDEYYLTSMNELFNSCNNLKFRPARTETKTSKANNRKEIIFPPIELDGLRNHLVTVEPKNYTKKIRITDDSKKISEHNSDFVAALTFWQNQPTDSVASIHREAAISNPDSFAKAKSFWSSKC